MTAPLLELRDVRVDYPVRSRLLRRVTGHIGAVAGVSLTVGTGETVGLVGESGCGKTSLARAIVGLQQPSGGEIVVDGANVARGDARRLHRDVQMVFQDPYSSLNPRRTVRQIIGEAWHIHKDLVAPADRPDALADLLRRVGLNPDHAGRYPHEFSGGQRQRIGIARALAVRPRLIVCDEAVSGLDVSVRAQIVNLLQDLQAELGVAYLFIAHDLSIVEHISHRVAVMYLGTLVECGERAQIFDAPTHPYTQSLLDAAPVVRPWLTGGPPEVLEGDPPSPATPPTGCRFHPRCRRAQEVCTSTPPPLTERYGRLSACHFAQPRITTPTTGQELNRT